MRTIIAGSRSCNSYFTLLEAIAKSGFNITTVISGHAIGIDQLGEEWAVNNNIPCEIYIPNWTKFGKAAGHMRNAVMASVADQCICVWDSITPGTGNMIDTAKAHKLKLYTHLF